MSDVFRNMKVLPLKNKVGNLLANGSVLVGGLVEVKFTVMQGSNGIFASLPARKGTKKDENGKVPWYPEVKIPNEELYKEFQDAVKNEFTKVMGGQQMAGEDSQDRQYQDGIPF